MGRWRSSNEDACYDSDRYEEMTLKDLEAELTTLSKSEKARLLRRLASDFTDDWPGIEKNEGVAGGAACIVRTRIPVWTLESYRRKGWSEAQILSNYDSLRASDLVNAWAYADANKTEIDRAIETNEAA